MAFPSDLNDFATKSSGETVSEAHINVLQDAVELIEKEVGVDGSAVATSLNYFLTNASGQFRNHRHDGGSDDGLQLDWDVCWSDAVHDHSSAGEGGDINLGGKLTAGANEIEGSAFDINGGTIDGVTIGGASAGAITCTTLTTGGKFTAGANEIEGSNFDINGGTINGITDLAIADGGTASSTASNARTALGVVIGSDVQAYNANTTFMTTGTYSGNNAATQAITGVGFQPKALMIYVTGVARENTDVGPYWKTDQDGIYACYAPQDSFGGVIDDDYIVSLDADGFTVGDGTGAPRQAPNVTGNTYTYIAWRF